MQALDFARGCVQPGDSLFVQNFFLRFFPDALPYVYITRRALRKCDWIIFQKACAPQFGDTILRQIKRGFEPLFANDALVIFLNTRSRSAGKARLAGNPARPDAQALWAELEQLEKSEPAGYLTIRARLRPYLESIYDPPAAPVRFVKDLGARIFSPKTLVLNMHGGGGFFSNFNKVVDHLADCLGHDGIRNVRVEWNAPPVEAGHNFPYGRQEDGNVWYHFFVLPFPPSARRFPEVAATGFANLRMTYRFPHFWYKSGDAWRWKYHAVYNRYIRIQPHIRRRVEELHSARMAGRYAIGIHARNDAHRSEHVSERAVTFGTFVEKINAALAAAPRDAVIFLATDVEETVGKFRAVYGDRLFVQPGVARLLGSPTGEYDHQLHHKNPNPSLKLGEDILIDGLLLANCDLFIHTVSNIATAVGFMNPRSRMVYCE